MRRQGGGPSRGGRSGAPQDRAGWTHRGSRSWRGPSPGASYRNLTGRFCRNTFGPTDCRLGAGVNPTVADHILNRISRGIMAHPQAKVPMATLTRHLVPELTPGLRDMAMIGRVWAEGPSVSLGMPSCPRWT